MTRFIDINMISEMIEKIGLTHFLQQMSDEIKSDFIRWEAFDKSARLAAHSDIGVIELMPAADDELYAFKYVNGHPGNTFKGLSTVMAFGALSEVKTGYPLLLSELTLTTAFRTAATSVMAARVLCREDSKIMAMIGCGAQSEFQAIAFHSLLRINAIPIYPVDPQAMEKLKHNLSTFDGLTVKPMSCPAQAVKGCDIVTTVTADKTRATILSADMVEPGMHINAIGGDCPGKTELHKDVLTQAKVFVEYEPQTRIEGDIQQLADDSPVTDLWRVLAGSETGRESDHQITVFDSVGFALEDFSALRYLHRLSLELGIGEDIDLVPVLDNPKDLFSLTKTGQPHSLAYKAA